MRVRFIPSPLNQPNFTLHGVRYIYRKRIEPCPPTTLQNTGIAFGQVQVSLLNNPALILEYPS